MIALCAVSCSAPAPSPQPVVLRTTPSTKPRLEKALSLLPDVSLRTVETEGAAATMLALQRGQVDIAMVSADLAYRAHARGGPVTIQQNQMPVVSGIAVLNVNTVYLAASSKSGIRSLSDLPGHRIGVGPAESTNRTITDLLLVAAGISLSEMQTEPVANQDVVVGRLQDGTLDAAFISLNSTVEAATEGGARLIDIEGAWLEGLRLRYPFLQSTLVPGGTYAGQDKPIQTVGIDLVLACLGQLDAQLVYRITHAYFDALQDDTPTIDLERAPATPIPLHPGAARYYRERALAR